MQPPRELRRVDVEVVLLGLTAGQQLTWQVLRGPLSASPPDDAALALAGAQAGPVCHSTSWRHDDGTLVLTYAVVRPAGSSGSGAVLEEPSVVCSQDARRPAPPALHAHHVVAHAVRHLADLAERDPVVAAALLEQPALQDALRGAARGTPVAPHAQAHALAKERSSPGGQPVRAAPAGG